MKGNIFEFPGKFYKNNALVIAYGKYVLDWKNFINIKNSAKKIKVLYIMIQNRLN